MGPLKGIRIVEFAGIGPGPFAAMLFSDMGADVIRVDRKGGRAPHKTEIALRGRHVALQYRRLIMLVLEFQYALLLLFDRGSPAQNAAMYEDFGLDPERVMADMVKRRAERDPTRRFRGETNIFRVLIKTLFNAGLITERTRGFYATYVDMEELQAEGERMVGDDIAEEGIRYLQAINFKDSAERGAAALIAAE